MSQKILKLSDGVEGLFIENTRFNTTLISFNLYLPLNEDTVAEYALLPFVLTTCNSKYVNFSRLNYKLNKLYGAQLNVSTEKLGDCQLLRFTISVINDKYALDDQSLERQASELIIKLLFEPKVIDNAFYEEDLNREKRKAIEHIKSEINEKRIFAKNRMIQEMYKGDPYGIPKCGTEAMINAVTGQSLYRAWVKMLKTAFVRIQVVGSSVTSGFFYSVTEKFSHITRENITDYTKVIPTKPITDHKVITDYMDVLQGKLVMGFSCDLFGGDRETLPLMVMSDIFGGGPYSRLFTNVREKMSLCYYCSSFNVRIKGLLAVDSGVEAQNADKAQKEILKQLDVIKNGKFTDFEFEASIKSLKDTMNTYNDSQESIDLWYALKISNGNLISPEQVAESIGQITKSDVVEAAKGVKLNTVYRLLPKSGEENNDC